MGTVTELRHTADVGFEVEAETLEELFRLAARGLSAALGLEAAREGTGRAPEDEGAGEDARVGDGRRRRRETEDPPEAGPSDPPPGRLELRRPDLERLLVSFLKELLFHASRLGARPEVTSLEMDREEGGAALRAALSWQMPGPEALEREIKGVTYHGLRVEREGSRWHARVVLDV